MALILAAALGACAPRAQAQQPVLPGKQICSNASGSTVCSFQPVTDASPLPVSATASIAGFNQETVLTPFTATTSGVTSGSFTAGKVIVVTNAGTTNMAYCRLGASATTSGQPIAPNGGWFAFTTVAETQVTCATSTSTTTINVGVGTGLPTGTGGGGGSGGGGAVTVADGADVTQGAIADAAVTAGGTGTLSAKLRYMTTQLDNINTNVQAAIPAGTNLIGDVNLRQGGAALSATNPIFSQPVSGSAGGATPTGGIAANSNNSTSIKGSAGTVYGIQTGNINSTTAYWLKLYDKATAPTCGTDTPVVRILIPPSNSGNNGTFPVGKAFTLGIGMCIVQGIADNDNTSVPAATIAWNVDYK